MVLSQQEVDQILKKIQDDYAAAFETGDPSKVAAFYDPNAVIIHTGKKVYFGIQEITKFFEDFMKDPEDFKTVVDKNFQAGNGDYLIQQGFFEMDLPTGHVKHPYEQIFKKQKDGRYLITRDEFDM